MKQLNSQLDDKRTSKKPGKIMNNPLLSLCYFPTTVMLVDDEPGFIAGVVSSLGKEVPLKTFTNPMKALDFLNTDYSISPFSHELILPAEDERDHINLNIDLRAVDQQIYNPKRFAEISVLVVDQAMPNMRGLELCRRLNRHKMRIILLTGEAGNDLAVEAFNQGLINQFIVKSLTDRTQVVANAIATQQSHYFINQSNTIIDNAGDQAYNLALQLSDPVFKKFFDELCQKYNIVEYYVLDRDGGFLLADDKKNVSILALKSDEILDEYHEFAAYGENVPDTVTSALKNRTHIPLFYLGSDLRTPPQEWNKYLHPATSLKGEYANYYYAFLPNAQRFGVKLEKIVSYHDYLFNPEKNS